MDFNDIPELADCAVLTEPALFTFNNKAAGPPVDRIAPLAAFCGTFCREMVLTPSTREPAGSRTAKHYSRGLT